MGDSGAPEAGDELGDFRLGRRLGAGGMGVVHEALDTQLQRQVALKIIAPHLAEDDEFRERFVREARAQASLDSPHVVQVYSFGDSGGQLFIASQLIPDGDLGQMLREHGLPPVRVGLDLLAQVADGLADAHAAGLVHRDIKPANVLLRHRDHQVTAYLADFGIAREVGAAEADPVSGVTQAGAAVGTPAYMAPELHLGAPAGPPCDIYSLGCMLWALVSGSAPYAGGTDYQVISGHVSGPLPQLEVTGLLALELNRVLARALAKDPEQRYPSATALRDDLTRLARLPDDAVALREAGGSRPPPSGPPAGPSVPPPSGPPAAARQFLASSPPTPPPAPSSLSSAPPAPGLQRGRAPSGSSAPASRRRATPRRRPWIPLAAVVLVLAIAAVVLVAVLSGGGGDEAGLRGSDTPATSSASAVMADADGRAPGGGGS